MLDNKNEFYMKKNIYFFSVCIRFTLKGILKENPENRLVVVEGHFSQDPSSTAVVLLEKTHFTESDIHGILTESTQLQRLFQNDIYGNFLCHVPPHLNAVKATIIHPATKKHIEKHSARESYLIEETPSIYELVTLPHIQETQFNIQVLY